MSQAFPSRFRTRSQSQSHRGEEELKDSTFRQDGNLQTSPHNSNSDSSPHIPIPYILILTWSTFFLSPLLFLLFPCTPHQTAPSTISPSIFPSLPPVNLLLFRKK